MANTSDNISNENSIVKKPALKIFLTFLFILQPIWSSDIFINEIDYDQDGTDNAEFIEICALAGSYSTVIVKCVNGNGNSVYNTFELGNITLSNESNGYGFYLLGPSGMVGVDFSTGWTTDEVQNGAPDAVELWVNGSVVDAVSYEDSGAPMTDSNGGSLEQTSGLSETNSTGNNSIGRVGLDGSSWQTMTITPGSANNVSGSNDQSLPVELNYFLAIPKNGNVLLKWATESEIENLGFILERKMLSSSLIQWTEIASFITHSELQGQGSVTYRTDYEFIDRDVAIGKTYDYRLSDVDYFGVKTDHPISSVTVTPPRIVLHKPWPNPFNPVTQFSTFVYEESLVSIKIFDSLGRKITTLVDSEIYSPGTYSFSWDGLTGLSQEAGSGIYYVSFESGENVISEKILLIR